MTATKRTTRHIGDLYDAQIIELYVEEGRPRKYIVQALGLDDKTVKRRLQINGVPIRKRKGSVQKDRLSHYDFERTAFLYERMHMSLQEVANYLGISVGAVSYRLRKAGVEVRSRGDGQRLLWAQGRGTLSGEALIRHRAKVRREADAASHES